MNSKIVSLHQNRNSTWLLSAEQMQALDRQTIERGTSSLDLMEKAASAAYRKLRDRLRGKACRSFVVAVGPGNNGGDGLVVARLLLHEGHDVQAILLREERISGETEEMLTQYRNSGGKCLNWNEAKDTSTREKLIAHVASHEVVIDALLGSGQSEAPKDELKSLLQILNTGAQRGGLRRVAIDTPSGINPTTGEVYPDAFRAQITVCIQTIKRGMLQYPARGCCGEIHLVDAGIFGTCQNQFFYQPFVGLKLQRSSFGYKNSFGHTLVLGGSSCYPGAVRLASLAVLKAGGGLCSAPHGQELAAEVIQLEDSYEALCDKSYSPRENDKLLEKVDQVLIGPGAGMKKNSQKFILHFLRSALRNKKPLIVDGDALRILATDRKLLSELSPEVILTPHPGEFASLIEASSKEVQKDRYKAVLKLSKLTPASFILKGANPIVWSQGQGYVFDFSEPLLSTAGSGDVFAGWLGGVRSQGVPPKEALFAAIELQRKQCAKLQLQGKQTISSSELLAS